MPMSDCCYAPDDRLPAKSWMPAQPARRNLRRRLRLGRRAGNGAGRRLADHRRHRPGHRRVLAKAGARRVDVYCLACTPKPGYA